MRRRWLGTICRKDLKEWDTALISKQMPERKRIVRFEIVFSCIHSFYVFPKSWSRNQSHIPARHEYVLKYTTVFGRFTYRRSPPQIQIYISSTTTASSSSSSDSSYLFRIVVWILSLVPELIGCAISRYSPSSDFCLALR